MAYMEESKRWQGMWIWTNGMERSSLREHELVYFRREFEVENSSDARLIVHVSADSRYRLYLNGESVAVGPCKGDTWNHFYETVDLTDQLKSGKNVLTAKVLHYYYASPWHGEGKAGPMSVTRADLGGFWLDGALEKMDGTIVNTLHSDNQWKCMADKGFHLEATKVTSWLGGLERVEGEYVPHNWQQITYDDSAWKSAVAFMPTRDNWGLFLPWNLKARPIPPLYETETDWAKIVRAEGTEVVKVQRMVKGADVLTVPPGGKIWAEFDAGMLATGYLQLSMTGGAGSQIRLLCAECYEPIPSISGEREKGIRDQAEGGCLLGEYDQYMVAGVGTEQSPEIYEPFTFRTARFVRLEVNAGDSPIHITRFQFRDTGYPLEVEGAFSCSDPELNQIWEISINTLLRCMHETYEDCPYYEQLQYIMDTRLQMMFTYQLSTDDRLPRRAIFDFHSSRLPSGMLQCRYPSSEPRVIPSFSLYWIHMLYEHYMQFGDLELIKSYRATMSDLLEWFDKLLTPEGLVGATPDKYWAYIDNVHDWTSGSPAGRENPPLTILSLMYAAALERAAKLFEWTGWRDAAQECTEKQERVNEAVLKICWSQERKIFVDIPHRERTSQHVQVWAVLSGAVKGGEARELLLRMLDDKTLDKVSTPMSFHLFRALEMTGLYQHAHQQWDRWRVFLGQHLTTFPEVDHKSPRSDCHAWSALPLSEFPMMVLGVQPLEPGFNKIRVAPQIEGLTWAKGTLPTVKGPIHIEWSIEDGDHFRISLSAPYGVPVELRLPDGTEVAVADCQSYEIWCKINE